MQPSIQQRMRVETCPQCAVVFSFPLDLYLLKLKNGGSIHCPAGHTISLSASAGTVRDGLIETVQQLQSELHQLRQSIAAMPEGPIDDAEFKRRVEVLLKRGKPGAYGRLACALCEKIKLTPGKMRVHLQTAHRGEILTASSTKFD